MKKRNERQRSGRAWIRACLWSLALAGVGLGTACAGPDDRAAAGPARAAAGEQAAGTPQGQPAAGAPAPAARAADASPARGPDDYFAPLRSAVTGAWSRAEAERADDALRHLANLLGASYDHETDTLLLHGDYTDANGPFSVEDLVVAMRAEYHQPEDLGVTIDPKVEDPTGPVMDVRLFAGSEHTHFGHVMFECDRLLKSYSLGKDSVTKAELKPEIEDFFTVPQLVALLKVGKEGKPTWNRFWFVSALDDYPDGDSRGKTALETADDGDTIWFSQHRVFVRTETMHMKGGELISSEGVEDPAAKRFATHFNVHFDDFARLSPVFWELKELSKLVVLARWLRERGLSFDPDLMYRSLGRSVETPTTTPSAHASFEMKKGRTIHRVQVLGGVRLTPKLFLAQDQSGKAKRLSDWASKARREHAGDVSFRWENTEGRDRQNVFLRDGKHRPEQGVVPAEGARTRVEATSEARFGIRKGPQPAAPVRSTRGARATARRAPPPEPVVEIRADGRMRRARPRESRGKADKQAAEDGEPPRYTLRKATDLATGDARLDLPALRAGYSPRRLARTVIEYGDRRFEVHKPEYLRLTSPSGDIGAVFDTEPKFDRGRKEPYFASEHPSVRGFYPERGEVLLTDGGRLTFDKDGALRKAELQGRPPLEVGYEKPVAQPASGPAKATSLPAHVIRSSPYGPPGGRRAKAVRNPKTGQVVRVSEL